LETTQTYYRTLDFNEYLSKDYEELVKASKKITGNSDLHLDLLHYAIEEMSNKQNIQGIVDSGGARFYCIRIMMTQWRSQTGPFYRQFVRANNLSDISSMDIPEVTETPLDMQKINSIIEALPWYDKELFKIYTEGSHNFSTLAKETGIPRTSIGLTINRVKKHIKRNL
jgi:hypothetical protein